MVGKRVQFNDETFALINLLRREAGGSKPPVSRG